MCHKSPCRCGRSVVTLPFSPFRQLGTDSGWLLLPGKSRTGGGYPTPVPDLSVAYWMGRLPPKHCSLRKVWELRLSASVVIRIFQWSVVPNGVFSLLCIFVFATLPSAQSSQPFEKKKVTLKVTDGALARWLSWLEYHPGHQGVAGFIPS